MKVRRSKCSFGMLRCTESGRVFSWGLFNKNQRWPKNRCHFEDLLTINNHYELFFDRLCLFTRDAVTSRDLIFSCESLFSAKGVRLMKRALLCTWRGKSMNIIFCNQTFWLWLGVTYHLHAGLVFFIHQLKHTEIVFGSFGFLTQQRYGLKCATCWSWCHVSSGACVTQTVRENMHRYPLA